MPPPLPLNGTSSELLHAKGRRHGYVRYKDFVEAMVERSSSRGGGRRKSGGTVEGGKGGIRRKGERSGARRRSSADDIERLVDTLKEVSRPKLRGGTGGEIGPAAAVVPEVKGAKKAGLVTQAALAYIPACHAYICCDKID